MLKIAAFSILGVFLLAVIAAFTMRSNGTMETPEGVRIFVKGVRPLYLKIYNSQEFGNHQELNGYIEKRQTGLERLVNQGGERRIEVSISPTQYLTITELLQIRDGYQLDIDGVGFEVFQGGQRRAATFIGERREGGEGTLIDFSQSREGIESGLRQLGPAPPPGSTDAFGPNKTEFKVAWIRGRLPASQAAALDEQDSIMQVDPITDLLDMAAGQAADIRVVDMPHLLDTQRLLQGGDYNSIK